MFGAPSPPKHSLRSRLLLLSGATFLLCAGVIILFFPLLNITLENLLERSVTKMREAKEMEALTIARLLVLEFSLKQELLEAKPGDLNEIDQRIMNLIWQKVTFNEVIEGIELIQSQQDSQGRRLTYLFYRREAPDLEPMTGPQKLLKRFSGAEKELLDGINSPDTVDKEKLEVSVNLGPKEEGQMILRYLPVHVLVPEEGAIFWGVAKIGVDVAGLTALQAMQDQEQNYLRKAILLLIILSLTISGIIAVSLLYLWARGLTEPLRTLSDVARDFKTTKSQEYHLWLDNLRRVDPRGQIEVSELKETLMRLGGGIPRLGERLFSNEYQACLSRLLARGLPAILANSTLSDGFQGELPQSDQSPLRHLHDPEASASAALRINGETTWSLEDQSQGIPAQYDYVKKKLERLENELADWHYFALESEEEWRNFDMTPTLKRAWRLIKLSVPPQTGFLEVQPLPPVWGSPKFLAQAVLLLLDYTSGLLDGAGQMTLKAAPLPTGGVQIMLTVSGSKFSSKECDDLLHPPPGDGHLTGSLGPAVAAAIIRWHGGELSAHPGISDGIGITLTLPPPPTSHEDGPPPE